MENLRYFKQQLTEYLELINNVYYTCKDVTICLRISHRVGDFARFAFDSCIFKLTYACAAYQSNKSLTENPSLLDILIIG